MDQLLKIEDSLMSQEFGSLADSQQRVEFAFNKIDSFEDLRQNVKNCLENHKNKNTKSLAKSQVYRQKGNRFFQNKDLESALYCFNLAVLSAPFPSDLGQESDNELLYAYTSRSLTFFEMKSYSNALFDIDSALHLSFNSMKLFNRIELMTHKMFCLYRLAKYEESIKMIETIIQLIPCLPINNELVRALIKTKEWISDEEPIDDNETQSDVELSDNYCKLFNTYMSRQIDLFDSEVKGRHYKTNEAIPKHTIVLIEKSISGVLFESLFKTHCQYCFKNIGYKYWPCSQCSQVVFCDQQCARSAYYHRFECGFADIIGDFGPTHHILYRIILLVGPKMAIDLSKQTLKQFEEFGRLDENLRNYLKFLQLIDHNQRYDLKTKVKSICRSILLAIILNTFEEFKSNEENVFKHLLELAAIMDSFNYKVLINSFGMYEQRIKCRPFRGAHIGNAVCFMASFFNHSCSPNLFWQFNGQHITAATTEEVGFGQELTISYGPNSETQSFSERQEHLKQRYFFQCNCTNCVKDAKQLPTLKCCHCSDGFLVYETNSIEGLCLICGKRSLIETIVTKVKQIDELFNNWIQKFEKRLKSEILLIKAEKCFSDLSKLLYCKSKRMSEINTKLSRSFQIIGFYSKAMTYSRNVLLAFNETESFGYCLELVFYSRVYYYYLSKERQLFAIDDEWRKCFQIISETILILKNCRKDLVLKFSDETIGTTDLKVIEKAIQVIDRCLKAKEQQICFISKLSDK